MRRHYAFESEELSSAVKDQLEKVEDAVDKKCTSVEACDKMLDKISAEQDKFNGCLKDMAGAAKDCKDGKCDSAEMAAKVSPKMAELKEVAKSIGVASEGETVTEDEVKAAKQYLEGAEEIVEAKKDELAGDDASTPSSDGGATKDDSCEDGDCDDGEDEDFDDTDDVGTAASEAYLDSIDIAYESASFDIAMEGANIDAINALREGMKKVRAARKEMKHAAKVHDYKGAAAAARKAADAAKEISAKCDQIPPSAGSAALVAIGLALLALLTGATIAGKPANIIRMAKATKAAGKAGELNAARTARDAVVNNYREAAKAGYDMMGGWGKQAAVDASAAAKTAAAAAKKEGKSAVRGVLAQGAKRSGIGGAKTAAAAGGAIAVGTGASALSSFFSKKGSDTKMNANDVNLLIKAIKIDAKRLADKYTKIANDYERTDRGLESTLDSASFDGFIDACESLIISRGANANRDTGSAPYLFD